MKIGKLFPKIAQTASKLDELYQIIKKEGEGKAWWNGASSPGNVTGQVVQRVLSDEQQKSWEQINGPNVSLYSRSWCFCSKMGRNCSIFVKNEQILATKRRIHQRMR